MLRFNVTYPTKKIVLKIVALFEIICGLAGFVMVLGGFAGVSPYEAVPILWYGTFPVLCMVAGVWLLVGSKGAFRLSVIALVLQIPYIYLSGTSMLRVAIAFNIYLTAVWNSKAGPNATVLGVNVLAIVFLILLLWSRDALEPESEPKFNRPPPPEFDSE
jgi:hypothetical protein